MYQIQIWDHYELFESPQPFKVEDFITFDIQKFEYVRALRLGLNEKYHCTPHDVRIQEM